MRTIVLSAAICALVSLANAEGGYGYSAGGGYNYGNAGGRHSGNPRGEREIGTLLLNLNNAVKNLKAGILRTLADKIDSFNDGLSSGTGVVENAPLSGGYSSSGGYGGGGQGSGSYGTGGGYNGWQG